MMFSKNWQLVLEIIESTMKVALRLIKPRFHAKCKSCGSIRSILIHFEEVTGHGRGRRNGVTH
jgi:hypothetical protein